MGCFKKDEILESGRKILGIDGCGQLDWFRDKTETLKPHVMPALFAHWLQSQCYWDRQRYIAKRRTVAQTVVPLRILGS